LSNRFSASAFDKNDKSAEQTLLGKLWRGGSSAASISILTYSTTNVNYELW
jgi:hypothetical protein